MIHLTKNIWVLSKFAERLYRELFNVQSFFGAKTRMMYQLILLLSLL